MRKLLRRKRSSKSLLKIFFRSQRSLENRKKLQAKRKPSLTYRVSLLLRKKQKHLKHLRKLSLLSRLLSKH